ncbi:MAG: outer membrane protein assembly factor BamD [Chitinophagaceae bacterium]|nr:outer membrane protein assembly factor BamD [Chitinophagaceae bacterium]
MKYLGILITAVLLLTSCKKVNLFSGKKKGPRKNVAKILKSKDPAYKLRMAEQFFVKKLYNKAQIIYEDILPFYRTEKEFEDVYYKYAYCAYYQKDYQVAENIFKTFLEIFPASKRAEEIDFMRAYCYYKMSPKAELDQTNTHKTIGMMQTFINTHPNSPRNKEAWEIIEKCRAKLEEKDYKSAKLYYDMGHFRAAGVAFSYLLNEFPESHRADEYKFMVIKSYFQFAELSVEEKKAERYEQVIQECNDFYDRFPGSKLKNEVDQYLNLCKDNLKKYNYEQTKTSV